MKILLSFTDPHGIPNLHDFLTYAEHKIWYFEEYFSLTFSMKFNSTQNVQTPKKDTK